MRRIKTPSSSLSFLRQRSLLSLALIASAALALSGCGKSDEANAKAAASSGAVQTPTKTELPRPVRTLVVGSSDLSDAMYLPGEVRARFEQRYGFRVAGKIAKRMVDVGQEVKAGQVLAVLDSQDVLPNINAQAAQVEVARTDLQFQQSELKRQIELREKGFVSGASLERQKAATDAAVARFNAARSQLASVQNGLNFQTLTADRAGVVVGVDVEAGSVVSAGQSVIRVAQLGEREVLINAPERALTQLKSAAGFLVAFDAVPGKFARAKLRELSPAADPQSRTYAARLSLIDAGDEVKLGMSATVRTETATGQKIVIPNTALYTRDNATRVWLVDRATETVKPVEVTLGESTNDGVIIPNGLKAGDLLVTAGANLLQPGQRIRLVEAAPTNQPNPPKQANSGASATKSDAAKKDQKSALPQSNKASTSEAKKP